MSVRNGTDRDTKVTWKMLKFFRFASKSGAILSNNIIGLCELSVHRKLSLEEIRGEEKPEQDAESEQFTLDSMVRSIFAKDSSFGSSPPSVKDKKMENRVQWRETFRGSAVYKFARSPHWGPFWEKRIFNVLREYCPFLTNFVGPKMLSCTRLVCDPSGFALPEPAIGSVSKTKKSRLVDMTIYDEIQGITFSNQIHKGMSRPQISAVLQQIFAVQYMAQLYCGYTHYDGHCSNVMLESDSEFSWFYYKFNSQVSVMVPSCGYRIKIIDFEFSHVDGLDGKNFDGIPDLFEAGYCPQRFDPEADPIYLTINAFWIHHQSHKDDAPLQMVRSFLKTIHSRPLEDKGFFCRTQDPMREIILQRLKLKEPFLYKFVWRWYERLIAFVLHFASVPSKQSRSKHDHLFQRSFFKDAQGKHKLTVEIVGDMESWISNAIAYFRFMYGLRSSKLQAVFTDPFVKIYDWIQHKGIDKNGLDDEQKRVFGHHIKTLSKITLEIYDSFCSVAFPLKEYDPSENWNRWRSMKQTKKYDSSLVFDPAVALDLVSSHLPTNPPSSDSGIVCISSFDRTEETAMTVSKEMSDHLSSISDPFLRAKEFESSFHQ